MTFGGLPTRWIPEGETRGHAVLLPGRAYSPAAPLLDLTKRALLQHGWSVQEVWWDTTSMGEETGDAFVRRHVEAAVGREAAQLVVGKSLGTRASAFAAEHGLDAIWLTPLLTESEQVAAIGANRARQLLVGGSADPFWDGEAARSLAGPHCTVVEIEGADHVLAEPDAVRTAEHQVEVARAVSTWLSRL